MKLDSRIEKLSDILACVNAEEAKKFIGQTGYFADVIYDFGDLSYVDVDILDDVKESELPFHAQNRNWHWIYFIPECRLKPKKKKYRPYTLDEFTSKFIVGQPLNFRRKGEKKDEWFSVLTGYWHHQIEDEVITYILIGTVQYTLEELFNEYEWYDDDTGLWKHFGVEE